MANAVVLKIVVLESRKFQGMPLYEWLLRQLQDMGVAGATVFRGMAGFGRHGRIHEDHFFELAGELPLQIESWLTAEQADKFLQLLSQHQLNLPYFRQDGEYGVTGGAV